MVKKEVIEKLNTLITAAFGLVAALAWNDTINVIFLKTLGTADTLIGKLSYSLFVTLIAVTVTIYIGRFSSKLNEGRNKSNSKRKK